MLTAPNGPAQEAVIPRALQEAKINALDVSYIVAHGTGTALGDPIEVRALRAVYGAGRGAEQALVVTSVKPNIGHLEAAAGIANIVQVVLALQYGEAPGILNLETLNPYIDMEGFAVVFPRETTHLSTLDEGRLFIGTSLLGFGGMNAHAILERAEWGMMDDLPSVKGLFEREAFPWRKPRQPMLRSQDPKDTSEAMRVEFSCELRGRILRLVQDHKVRGKAKLPGAATLELALASGAKLGLGGYGGDKACLGLSELYPCEPVVIDEEDK